VELADENARALPQVIQFIFLITWTTCNLDIYATIMSYIINHLETKVYSMSGHALLEFI
jgi:hypothetical protein